MEIVSGKTGSPHVTSQQFRQILEGTIGQGSCILTSGENLEPELTSNNLLKIRSGIMAHHGNVSAVKIGTYDEVTITNGTQGMKRKDLVVNRYTRNKETGIETNEWLYIMGTPTSGTPTVPAYTKGNLQEGDLVDDCPVFEITLDGINVTEVKKLLDVLPPMATIREDMIPSTETLKSGVRLQRMGKLRILNLVDTSSAADGTIINLAANDRPANYVFAPAVVRGQTYPDFFISVTPASMGTGKVGLFRGANVQMQYDGYICSQIAWLVD